MRQSTAAVVLAAMLFAGPEVAAARASKHRSAHARHVAAASADPTSVTTSPALSGAAATGVAGMSDAEKMRRLDIMLMVTGLRCRDTEDDFQADFSQFETNHARDLKTANRQLQSQLLHQYGSGGAAKRMDHINVEMANTYGNGHPWLGCHDLKGLTRDMALMRGSAPVLTVASQLLGSPKITAQPQ